MDRTGTVPMLEALAQVTELGRWEAQGTIRIPVGGRQNEWGVGINNRAAGILMKGVVLDCNEGDGCLVYDFFFLNI